MASNPLNSGAEFYSTAQFKLLAMVEEESIENVSEIEEGFKLMFCKTCKILRPPRSFHCSSCNACIEVQDHHCPWVGTCVGHRNHKYFALFLLMTSLHSLFSFILSFIFFLSRKEHRSKETEQSVDVINLFVVTYSGIFSLTLFCFWAF